MPFRLGLVAYPLAILAIAVTRRTAAGAFDDANAYDPDSSRRPESLGVSTRLANRAVAKGLLVPVGDGRYYLNKRRARRREVRLLALAILPPLAFAALVLAFRLTR